MRKFTYISLIMLLTTVLLTGCLESEQPFENDPNKELPEEVNTNFLGD